MRKLALLFYLLPLIMATGCALHISGLQDDQGRQTLYVFNDEHDAFAAAHSAIVSLLPDAPVKAAGGPIRGFTVTEKNIMSNDNEAAYTVNVIPGAGLDRGGKEVNGYYAEVTVKEEGITGRMTAKNLYRAVIENFAKKGRPVEVEQITIGKYKAGGFLRSGGSTSVQVSGSSDSDDSFMEISGSNASLADELAKLNELRRNGGLTQKEYDELKARLMKQ
ncbi:hypothetical protein C4J81_05805 [Deltaproteobacteria bacterium Smac51]|nr:hypothetical protein C4J81_05805 [Deltaproteobacteria bacterium Smac51]